MPLPTKQSFPSFLYTKDVVNIDVVPNDTTATYEIGDIISFASAVEGSGGFYQGTEFSVVKGKKHDPTYADADALAFLGVMVERYPPNKFLYKDDAGLLTVDDYTKDVVTGGSFAGDLERMTVCVMPNIVLVDFWDATNDQAESLASTDVFDTVYASKSGGGDTGKAGKASLARSNGNASSLIAIGRLLGIPKNGGNYGYVFVDPLGAR